MTAAPLRIGLLARSWGPGPGGVETVLEGLAGTLSRRGHTVCAVAPSDDPELPDGAEVDEWAGGVALRRIGWSHASQRHLADLVRNPRLERAAARWVADFGLDLVHVHHLGGWGLGVPVRLAELSVPVVWTLHDYGSVCPRGQLFSRGGEVCRVVGPEPCGDCWTGTWPRLAANGRPGRFVAERLDAARRAFDACARLLVPTEAAREAFRARGVDVTRIAVCENGVDRIAPAHEIPIPDGATVRVGYLGAVQPSKGVLEIARVLRELGERFAFEVHGPRDPYHGDRSYAEALESLADRSAGIALQGAYRRRERARILAGLDLVVAPSLWPETHGLAAREARAAGRPVFASAIGGLDDERSFHLLPPGDWPAWRAALERFADDPAWREALCASPYEPRSVESMVGELEIVYSSLVG